MRHVSEHMIQSVDIFLGTEEMALEITGDNQCSSVVTLMTVCKLIIFVVVWFSFIVVVFRGFNTERALNLAKENVEKHYAVVGVLEEMNKTLTVLEHYVPRFFKGAQDVYFSK